MTDAVTPSPTGSPSLTVRTSGTATELTLRTPLARWFRLCLWSLLPTLFVAVPVIAVLSGKLSWPIRLVPLIAIAVVVLTLLFLVLIAFVNFLTTVRLIVDGQTLHLQPPGRRFSIPLRDIRGVSLSTHPRRRLDIDPSQPPCRLFSLRHPVSLDIDTPAGRIRFLRSHTPADVPPLLAALTPLLNLPPTPNLPAPAPVANSDGNTRGELLFLRGMVVVVLLIAAGLAYWELIPAYQSRHWPTTPGQITHSHWERIESTGPKKEVTYKSEVAYSYTVHFNSYTNDRLAFGHDNPETVLRDYLQSHPAGSAASIYYNPSDPAQSTLIPGPGPIDWFLAATAGFLLLLTLPLLRRRGVPPEELCLLARYRVHPHTTKDVVTLESVAAATADLPHWTTPPDVFERAGRKQRRAFLVIAVRTTVLLLLIEYAFYAYLLPHIPVIFDRSRLIWPLLGLNVMAIAPFAFGAIARGKPAEFCLTPEGIRISSRERPLLRYNAIDSFTVEHDAAPPHPATLNLHTQDGVTRAVPLPSALAEEIVTTVSRHLPQRPPSQRCSSLRRRDWVLGLIVTTAYTIAVGLVIRHVVHALPREWAGLIFLLAFTALGPGTIAAIPLYRRRATAQLYSLAIMFNMIGGLSTLIYAALPKVMTVMQ